MIGQHSVVVIPDTSVPAWSDPLNSNPFMTLNGNGWWAGPFSNTAWVWQAGTLIATAHSTGGLGLFRTEAAPVARDLSGAYRVRYRGKVTGGNGWLILSLIYGRTAYAASAGPFWAPDDAISREQWFRVDGDDDTPREIVVNAVDVPAGYKFLGPNVQWYSTTGDPTAWSIDSLEVAGQIVLGGDVTCLVDSVAIKHGRDSSEGQPDASTATIDMSFDSAVDVLPAAVEVGATVRVATTVAGLTSVRFTGTVTDVVIGWDDEAEDTPNAAVVQVIASGPLALLGSRIIGDQPWPQEVDGTRVARILALGGVVTDPATSDPGTVQILARDVDAQPALGLAQEVAESASGIVWETRGGDVRYADAEHRRNVTASLTLDACDVLVTPTWRRDTAGLVNAVSIGYGTPPVDEEGNETGEQPRYVDSRPDSQARYGVRGVSLATVLAALADAQALATLLLTRNVRPVWLLQELPVSVADLDESDTAALLGMDMHDLLGVTGLPAVGTLPTSTSLWVEGWTETLTYGGHDLALFVSGYCRTAPAPRWDDLSPAMTWDTVSSLLTWDDAACLGPQPSLGRWADVPASLRWDTVPAATTWDTWKG